MTTIYLKTTTNFIDAIAMERSSATEHPNGTVMPFYDEIGSFLSTYSCLKNVYRPANEAEIEMMTDDQYLDEEYLTGMDKTKPDENKRVLELIECIQHDLEANECERGITFETYVRL